MGIIYLFFRLIPPNSNHMSDGKFICYARKIINNPLLQRKQVMMELIHPDQGNVSKTVLKDKIAGMFKAKPEAIAIFGLKSKFGGGRSSGFALIYDNLDARKKCDSKNNLRRDGMVEKPRYTRK